MAIHHSDRAHASARRLRKAVTFAEVALWTYLRDRQVDGLRFRRQVPLGAYVVDFCCLSHRLVVEADGGVHTLREQEDAARDAWLAEQGFTVLRFANETILARVNVVLEAIRDHAAGYLVATPHPSRSASHLPPQGGKGMKARTEIWFYHLERSSLDDVLPGLLEKTLDRGWRAVVRASDGDRAARIDERLWTYRDDAFLPHGRSGDPHAERQPILITESQENPNAAQALFIVDGSELGVTEAYDRCFILFDGRDETALMGARERWKTLKAAGADLAYWKQSPEGRWEKAA